MAEVTTAHCASRSADAWPENLSRVATGHGPRTRRKRSFASSGASPDNVSDSATTEFRTGDGCTTPALCTGRVAVSKHLLERRDGMLEFCSKFGCTLLPGDPVTSRRNSLLCQSIDGFCGHALTMLHHANGRHAFKTAAWCLALSRWLRRRWPSVNAFGRRCSA